MAGSSRPPAQSGGQKRKAPSGKADAGPLTPAEIARRHRQRELAKLATKLRSEGKEYKRKGPKNKPKIRSKGKIQVVVIPVFWKQKKAEQAAVFRKVEQAVEQLREVGAYCVSDTTNELMPGEKFKQWEERGVPLRVEIGPREAETNSAVLAVAKGAGEVADRGTVLMGRNLQQAVMSKIQELGLELKPRGPRPPKREAGAATATASGAEAGVQQELSAAAGDESSSSEDEAAEETAAQADARPAATDEKPSKKAKKGDAAAPAPSKKAPRAKAVSGDQLDDFILPEDAEAAEEAAKKEAKPKKKAKKEAKLVTF